MGNETIPERLSGQTILKSFFNTFRDAMKGNHVPRNTSGVATDQAGDLGESSFRWGSAYLKDIFMGVLASGFKMSEDGSSFRFDAATGKDYKFYINSVLKFALDATGFDGQYLQDDSVPFGSRVARPLGTGLGNISTASSSGTNNVTSASYVSIPNQTITLTTNGGAVMLMVQGSGGGGNFTADSTTGDNASGFVRIFRTNGASQITEVFLGGFATGSGATASQRTFPCNIITGIDVPSAGTQTYRLEAKLLTGSKLVVQNVSLVAIEV